MKSIAKFSVLTCIAFSLTVPAALSADSNIKSDTTPQAIPAAVVEQVERVLEPSFPIGNKLSRAVQKYSGVNLLTELISSQVTKLVIKKKLGGKVKVKVRTFSLTDLIAGKIKSVDVDLGHSKLKAIDIGEVHMATKGPVWVSPFKSKKRQTGLNSPVALSVKGKFSQKDVRQALKSKDVISSLRGLKLDLPGLGEQQLDVIDPKVKIEDDLLKIDATLITQGADKETGVPIKIEGRPRLVDGSKINVEDLKVTSDCIEKPDKFATFLSSLLNPIVNFARLDSTTHAFRLNSLQVEESMITGHGELILVPKNYQAQVAQTK